MKTAIIYSSIICLCLITGFAQAQNPFAGQKILIVYLSRTNNTQAIAELIQHNVGGRMVALELEKPYPQDYKAIVQQVAEENERGFLPPLKTKIDDIKSCDIVFIGYPTWGMQLPPPMKSFLNQYDLSGKTIIPFNTNGGYGEGSTLQTVKKLCAHSKVLKSFTMEGGLEKEGKLLVIKGAKRESAASAVKKWLIQISQK